MKKRQFSDNLPPACAYCRTGVTAADGTVLCKRNGVMQPTSMCKKYVYDPVKGTPKEQKINTDFTAEDFSL